MKSPAKSLAAAIAIFIAVTVCAPSPDASNAHFAITNNDTGYNGMQNTGTILQLLSNGGKPSLSPVHTLETGVQTLGGTGGVQVLRVGSDICIFLGNPNWNGSSISAFKYPGLNLVGNFADPMWSQSADGLQIAARGSYLFAGFQMNVAPYPAYIDAWAVGAGCQLTLEHTYPATNEAPQGVVWLAVTPDAETLVASYGTREVDSFSIGAEGVLTEHGPYEELRNEAAVGEIDITADSAVALFSIDGDYPDDYTDVAAFAINVDGSLGRENNFGGAGELGPGQGTSDIWLSPDERFLFVVDNISQAQRITTLNFSENPLGLTYAGCIATPRNLQSPNTLGILVTALPAGSGGGLYAAEETGDIALFAINNDTGCLHEVTGSPFPTGEPVTEWITAWPPRPF